MKSWKNTGYTSSTITKKTVTLIKCKIKRIPSPHSGHPDNSHTLLNVSHLGNEVPGSKKINKNNKTNTNKTLLLTITIAKMEIISLLGRC